MIQAWKLRGLAADQSAPTRFAGFGESGNELIENGWIQAFDADVIEKKERACTGHRDIVNAMVHQVLRNSRVLPKRDGNFQLGSNPVDARDQHRLLESLEIRFE